MEAGLDTGRRARLDRLLANEIDMAFRRRVVKLLGYLELRDGTRVLDCGCGAGFYLMAMSELWNLELDRPRRGSREASRGAQPRRRGRARPRRRAATAVRGRLVRRSADVGGTRASPADQDALEEVSRVLRPGGVLAVSVPHERYPFAWDPINRIWTAIGGQPIRRGPIVGIWTNHVRLYEPGVLVDRLRNAGFSIEAVEETTHYCVPFMHFLVYGIGKPLFEHGLVPERLLPTTDRFSGLQNPGHPLNPFNLVRDLLRRVDSLNERASVSPKAILRQHPREGSQGVSIVHRGVRLSRPGVPYVHRATGRCCPRDPTGGGG